MSTLREDNGKREGSSIPDSQNVEISKIQDLLLQEIVSPKFVPTAKVENIVLSVFLKLITQFFECGETTESVQLIEKHLVIVNEIVARDPKFLEVILKVCSTDVLGSLTSLLESPLMSQRFLNEMTTLLLCLSKFSTEKDKPYLGVNTASSLLMWIKKLGPGTKSDCPKLLRILAESVHLKNYLCQKENLKGIVDLTVSVLSEGDFNEDLVLTCLDLIIFLCDDRTELLKICADGKLEDCLLKRDEISHKPNIQQLLHKISCSANSRNPAALVTRETKPRDSGFLLSISDLKISTPAQVTSSQAARQRKFYLSRGSFLPTANLSRHVFLDVRSLKEVTGPSVVRAVCGLLNAGKGGFVYVGVNSSGLIHGLEMTRTERDSFRCGIDQYLRAELDPTLSPSLIDVVFAPVHLPRGSKSNQELFVLSIRVPADMGGIYVSKRDGKIYLHKSANTIEELGLRDVRRLAAEIGTREFGPIVRQLEQELEILEKSKPSRTEEFDLVD